MKILLTNTGPWGSGSFMVVNAIAKELLNLGHQVKIFFPDSGIESKDKEVYYGHPELYDIWQFPIQKNDVMVPTFPLIIPDSLPRNPNKRDSLTFRKLTDAQFKLYFNELNNQLKRTINDFKPDIIECQHIWAMNYVVHQLGYPHITSAHMSDQIGYKYDERMQPIAHAGAQHSNFIFAISEHVKKNILSLYDIDEKKIVVTQNGFDRNIFKEQTIDREEVLNKLNLDIPKGAILATFSGRIVQRKGIDIILEANRLIDPKHNIHFLMFGEGHIEEVLDVNNKRYHFERVHFLGHHNGTMLAQAHNIAKLSVAPSREEGFGIAVLEAMACGIPVIVAKDSGPESFAIGEIIDQNSPQQLADAIVKIATMAETEHHSLCYVAHKTANTFTWTSITKKRLTYYQQMPTIQHL